MSAPRKKEQPAPPAQRILVIRVNAFEAEGVHDILDRFLQAGAMKVGITLHRDLSSVRDKLADALWGKE